MAIVIVRGRLAGAFVSSAIPVASAPAIVRLALASSSSARLAALEARRRGLLFLWIGTWHRGHDDRERGLAAMAAYFDVAGFGFMISAEDAVSHNRSPSARRRSMPRRRRWSFPVCSGAGSGCCRFSSPRYGRCRCSSSRASSSTASIPRGPLHAQRNASQLDRPPDFLSKRGQTLRAARTSGRLASRRALIVRTAMTDAVATSRS